MEKIQKDERAALKSGPKCMHHNFIMAMARLLMLSDKKKQLIDKGSEGRAGTGIDTGKDERMGMQFYQIYMQNAGSKETTVAILFALNAGV